MCWASPADMMSPWRVREAGDWGVIAGSRVPVKDVNPKSTTGVRDSRSGGEGRWSSHGTGAPRPKRARLCKAWGVELPSASAISKPQHTEGLLR